MVMKAGLTTSGSVVGVDSVERSVRGSIVVEEVKDDTAQGFARAEVWGRWWRDG